jgi:CubicO group peptidase (beta-lactamase class C family)
MRRIDDYLKSIESRYPGSVTPGYYFSVVRHGEVEYERTFGHANLEWQIPIDRYSVFHLASESKQFTACLVMKLVLEDRIKIDEDVRKMLSYCQDFPYPVKVKDLLRHTTGIPDYLDKNLRILARSRSNTVDSSAHFGINDARRAIKERVTLQKEPSNKYCYSNSNYIILADMITHITNVPFDQLAKDSLFDPLGMQNTFVETDRSTVVNKRVTSYSPNLLNLGQYQTHLKNFSVYGDVGIQTCAEDLVLWEKNFWEDNLHPKGIINSLLNFEGVTRDNGLVYGAAIEFGRQGSCSYISHGGRMDGFKSLILRLPSHSTSLIYLANCDVPTISSEMIAKEIAKAFTGE